MKNLVLALCLSLVFNVVSVGFFTIEIQKMDKELGQCKR